MTKGDLIEAVYTKTKENNNNVSKKQVNELVDTVFASLAEAIRKDGRFSYPGFGTFTVKIRKAREGRNPQNGEPLHIPASKTVGFKPAPKFKQSLGPVEEAVEPPKPAPKKKATKSKGRKKSTKKSTSRKKK